MTDFSYQLYSSRNFPPLENTFKMLSDLGYKGVEGYGALVTEIDDPSEVRAQLDQYNLKMTSCHIGLDFIQDETARAISLAKTVGIEQVFVPFLMPDSRPNDADGWRAFGKVLAEAGKPIVDAGLAFGWHNHDFEFTKLATGELPMDLILDIAPDLSMEFDVAWAVKANSDPIDFINKYTNRITAAHLKDIAPVGECLDEDGWADVGHGTVAWPHIFAALKAVGTELFIMEHDNPSDHQRFASRALASAQQF
jgi:sugar phosphate isomerase/epimerase